MISLQDGIKYLGLTAIVYFLIKAFANDKLDNKQLVILVVLIMAIVIFIVNQQVTCPKKMAKMEHYRITEPPLVDSIYPGPSNVNEPLGKLEKLSLPLPDQDADLEDFKSIMGIDEKVYKALVGEEIAAEKAIRSRYENEMVFTDSHPFNTIPLGTQLYGYTYLPPENWFRAYERPPVCVTEKRCPVCPIAESSTADLMHFDTANNVMGPDGINLRYVKKMLNKEK